MLRESLGFWDDAFEFLSEHDILIWEDIEELTYAALLPKIHTLHSLAELPFQNCNRDTFSRRTRRKWFPLFIKFDNLARQNRQDRRQLNDSMERIVMRMEQTHAEFRDVGIFERLDKYLDVIDDMQHSSTLLVSILQRFEDMMTFYNQIVTKSGETGTLTQEPPSAFHQLRNWLVNKTILQ